MTSQGVPSRKRPAPGTSPAIHAPMGSIPGYTDTANRLSDDQFLQWGQDPQVPAATTQNFPIDPNPYNALAYATTQDVAATSNQPPNQLTKRPMNQNQLINRNRSFEQSSVSSVPESSTGDGWGESVAELEQRALIAKRDAQAKRKQIPPFVQKLRSFLDAPQYKDFIRWSDDGNSFIVLDEDEFARRLIPELFKHNKYASFVRQLNMYGFHKKVGLSDNSMRASERKNKSPSEYANPYFKRNHPDLLWLIQKPKNASGQGSKGGGKGAKVKTEDGEEHDVDDFAEDGGRDERPRPGGQLAITSGEDILPKDQLAGVYRELQNIRQQQQIISSTILKLRREHEQLYAQAANFQEQHSRHENSINAILTFLATVYNRSLQGHDGPQNIANSLSGIISQDQGNVVDVDDDYALSTLGNDLAGPRFKRQPLLLKAPPQVGANPNNRATTLSPATTSYDGVPSRKLSRQQPAPTGNVEEIQDGTSPQPPVPARSPQDQRKPSRDIMSMIQNSNAANGIQTTFTDFPNIVSSLETSGGNSALTPKQRADMLRQIARDTHVSDPGSLASSNNALITPTPPPMPDNYSAQLASTRNEIDNLMKMQAEQDRSVQNLTNLLQPLSPNGHIPGIEDGNVPPPSLDLDQFFNSRDYFTDLGEGNNNFDIGDTTTAAGIQNYKTSTADDRNAHDSSELFDFDNLGTDTTDLFGDHHSRTSAPTGYFDNYEDYTKPGAYNNNDDDDINSRGIVDNNNNNSNNRNQNESGRIIETFTDSEETSPANTADENYSSLNIPDPANVQSPKRRKKA